MTDGRTPLHEAAVQGNEEMVKYLIFRGAQGDHEGARVVPYSAALIAELIAELIAALIPFISFGAPFLALTPSLAQS